MESGPAAGPRWPPGGGQGSPHGPGPGRPGRGHVMPFFVILKCCPLSSVRTWGREMAALGSPVSSLVITAVHSSAVNSFLLSHPSSSGGGARPDSSLPAPVRPGPGPPHSPTPKTAELAWPPAPGPRLPQLPPAGIPVEFKILPWIGVTHDIGQATTHCHGGLEQHGGKGPLRV